MKKEKIQNFLLPVVPGIILLVLLQSGVLHKLFNIKVLQLPLPMDIAEAVVNNIDKILQNAVTTMVPAITGLMLGALIGYAVALLVTTFPNGGYGSLFIMTMINSVPIVALAPLMNRWFSGAFTAKLAVITIASSGAMAVNAFRGLNDLPKNVLELMRANAAPKHEVFTKVRIPNSLPSVFTALKIGVSAAMLATIISEFFSSETSGLGYMIKYTLKVGNQKQIGWAYIVAVSAFSIALFGIISIAEKKLLKWNVPQNAVRK